MEMTLALLLYARGWQSFVAPFRLLSVLNTPELTAAVTEQHHSFRQLVVCSVVLPRAVCQGRVFSWWR